MNLKIIFEFDTDTSISALVEWLNWALSNRRVRQIPVIRVSADGFQGTEVEQRLMEHGWDTEIGIGKERSK